MKYLVTGGCGFIGSNFIHQLLTEDPAAQIVNVDLLTYAGNEANLAEITAANPGRYRHEKLDIADSAAMLKLFQQESPIDFVVNFAAESHVDRSIDSPENFVHTNITGTLSLLNAARSTGVGRFLQVSTDEVYGSLGAEGLFTEESPLAPSSPYSASKASADLLAHSYFATFQLPVLITRCSNNYGPYQFPEKLIPLMITQALADKPLPVYGDGRNVRDWIHVDDHCRALRVVLHQAKPGDVYNIGAKQEQANIDVVQGILRLLNKPESLINYVTDRLGHDRRYAIDNTKIENELGWQPQWKFSEGLAQTLDWYRNNTDWWQPLLERAHGFRKL